MNATVSPTLNASRCVHAHIPNAHCQRCVDICPQGAWAWEADALMLDTGRCDGCRLCVAHCPNTALTTSALPTARPMPGSSVSIRWLACEQAVGPAATVPCLHGIRTREWAEMAHQNEKVTISETACTQCDRYTQLGARLDVTQRWMQRVAVVNRVRFALGRSELNLERLPPEDWLSQKQASELAAQAPAPRSPTRRAFFKHFLREAPPSETSVSPAVPSPPLAPFADWPGGEAEENTALKGLPYAPVVDPQKCTGCGACTRICPSEVLTFHPETGIFSVQAKRCTDCGLCVDVCEDHAIQISTDTAQAPQAIALTVRSCSHCQTRFVEPLGQTETLCQPCRRTRHPRGLLRITE